MDNKKKMIIGAAVLAGTAVIGGGLWLASGRGGSGKGDNVVYVNAVENLMNPGSGNGVVNRFAGVVETQETLEIQNSQEKTVKEIYVEEGQEVKKGTPLFAYDTEKSQEDLSKAQLELERIDNEIGNKYNELAALEKEKKNADKSAQLEYTIQIQEAQMEVKRSEYEKKSKLVEIQKLKDDMENSVVESEMDGVVKAINDGTGQMDMYGNSQAFMTIIAMGDFRIKGMINEQNMGSIIEGQPVLVHSRVDEDVVWKGTMGKVDTENPGNNNNNGFYVSTGDATTQSNSYPFYVELDSSQGLMLGQHVYIEADYGQEQERAGVWLDDYFIADRETDHPYVWVDNGRGKLEQREIILGQHDDEMMKSEIADGLTEKDLITFPEAGLEEGMDTAKGTQGQMGQSNPEPVQEDESQEDISMEEMPTEEMPTEEMPTEEMPTEEMLTEEMPVEEMPADGARMEGTEMEGTQ